MTEGHTERLETALDGKYRIERKLGEGGMASVYLAEDIKHKRKVALKILRPELAAVIGAERFLTEITTTANLQHPHILPLFDSGESDGFLYYVMPFIDGETLKERIEREQQLGVDESIRIAKSVADALDYAHRAGVIHRDIKPANILLHDGRPVVADFGIALAVSAARATDMTEYPLVSQLQTRAHEALEVGAVRGRELSTGRDGRAGNDAIWEAVAATPSMIEEPRTFARLDGANRYVPVDEAAGECDVFFRERPAQELAPREGGDGDRVLVTKPAQQPGRLGTSGVERPDQKTRVEMDGLRCGPDHGPHSRSARVSRSHASVFSGVNANRFCSSSSAATASAAASTSSTRTAASMMRRSVADLDMPHLAARRSSAATVSGSSAKVERTVFLAISDFMAITHSPQYCWGSRSIIGTSIGPAGAPMARCDGGLR